MIKINILFFIILSVFSIAPAFAKEIKIAVNQYVHHPNLTEVLNGFTEVMDAWAQKNSHIINYDIKNAVGNTPSALLIARQQAYSKNDLILALATPSAQAAVGQKPMIPIVFAAITDPVTAGLVKSLENPQGNATGTSDIGPYEKQFELFRQVFPNAIKVGVLHNPSEINSVVSMRIIRQAARKYNFILREVPISSTNEVIAGARTISTDSDIFYMPADNTVLSSLSAIVRIAEAKKIPLLVGDEGSVKLGGLFTLGVNYYKSGQETAKIGIQILEGKKPSEIPVSTGRSTRLVINVPKAIQADIRFPAIILHKLKDAIYIDGLNDKKQ